MITGDDETATPVPGAPYTFSALKRAQALGDLQALQAHGRQAARIHVRAGEDRGEVLRGVLVP